MPSKLNTNIKNKHLCHKYPFLTCYIFKKTKSGKYKKVPDHSTTWQDELAPGWVNAFCPQMWDELKSILKKAKFTKDFEFSQIKEKWGALRLYYGGVPESIFDEVSAWSDKYEDLSEKYCLHCGKPTAYMTHGWVSYICEDCAKKIYEEGKKKTGRGKISLMRLSDATIVDNVEKN